MELTHYRYGTPRGFTEHALVLDDDEPGEQALCEATPTLGALLALAVDDVDEAVATRGDAVLEADHWKMQRGALEDGVCTRCLAGAMLARVGVEEMQSVTIILDRTQLVEYERGYAETRSRETALVLADRPPRGARQHGWTHSTTSAKRRSTARRRRSTGRTTGASSTQQGCSGSANPTRWTRCARPGPCGTGQRTGQRS